MIYSIRDNTLNQNVSNIVRCRDCGLNYLNPQPTQEELAKYYPKDYYSFIESDASKRLSVSDALRYKLIRSAIVGYFGKDQESHSSKTFYTKFLRHRFGGAPEYLKKGRILDVGCGDGFFLSIVKEIGWDVFGVEINKEAADKANKRGLNVFCGNLEDAGYAENYFDVIRLSHSFEHFTTPYDTLSYACKILKHKGKLIISVPNFDSFSSRIFSRNWAGLDVPRHLFFFTASSMRKMLESAGLVDIEFTFYSVGTGFTTVQDIISKHYSHLARFSIVFLVLLKPLFICGDCLFDLLGSGDCIEVFSEKASSY